MAPQQSPDTSEQSRTQSKIDWYNNAPNEGFTFHWLPFLIAAGYLLSQWDTINWTFYLCLVIVVLIHETGHVVTGLATGCAIQRMQVFFFSFIDYKPRGLSSGKWSGITWSLGVLPWGGYTQFRTIPESPAKRLLISAGGILFNLLTFGVLLILGRSGLISVSTGIAAVLNGVLSLSLVLAVLNILPVYPLDGGAMLIHFIEMATGKGPSPKLLKTLSYIGFGLIIIFFFIYTDWVAHLMKSIMSLL